MKLPVVYAAYTALLLLLGNAAANDEATRPLSSRLILPPRFQPAQVFRNVNLVHLVNLEKSYVKESINVLIENISDSPQDEYYVPFTSMQMERLGGLEVKDKKDADAGPFKVEAAEIDMESDTQFYRIILPRPLPPSAQQTLGISFFYRASLTPSPPSIAQSDKQYLTYTLSAYCPTSYLTIKQKTEIKFPSAVIESATVVPGTDGQAESPQKAGPKYTYGSFANIPGGAYEPVVVRYEYTHPIPYISRLERDIEVSHWGGNIAFEDRYTLTNHAANLSKQFSRLEFAASAHYNAPSTAIKALNFPLRAGSQDAYYTDVIGNVSTSRWRSGKKEAHLEIRPRYPIFGRWNYPFRIGWNADLAGYVRRVPRSPSNPTTSSSASVYILRVPFLEGPRLSEGATYDLVETRIILPEGAHVLDWSSSAAAGSSDDSPYPLDADAVEIGLHRTFMDTVGRTTLTLRRRAITDDWSGREVVVVYELNWLSRLRKPLVVGVAVLVLFAGTWALGTVDLRIGQAVTEGA